MPAIPMRRSRKKRIGVDRTAVTPAQPGRYQADVVTFYRHARHLRLGPSCKRLLALWVTPLFLARSMPSGKDGNRPIVGRRVPADIFSSRPLVKVALMSPTYYYGVTPIRESIDGL